MQADNLISLQDAARLLKVSSRTMRRLVDRGQLVPVRVGVTLAFRPCDLPGGGTAPLLTVHDAAARLGCSPRMIRALAARGELRPIEVGGTTRWSPAEVDALAKRGLADAG